MCGHSGLQAESHWKRIKVWKNEIKGKGQIFASAERFWPSIWKFSIAHRFEYPFQQNYLQCIVVVRDAKECECYICVRGVKNRDRMIVKEFRGSAHIVQVINARWADGVNVGYEGSFLGH